MDIEQLLRRYKQYPHAVHVHMFSWIGYYRGFVIISTQERVFIVTKEVTPTILELKTAIRRLLARSVKVISAKIS